MPSATAPLQLLLALRRTRHKVLFVMQLRFVAALLQGAVPELLCEPMLDAGINEVNPSLNRGFIEPCKETFGPRRVNEYLLDAVAKGDDLRKAGAVNALY